MPGTEVGPGSACAQLPLARLPRLLHGGGEEGSFASSLGESSRNFWNPLSPSASPDVAPHSLGVWGTMGTTVPPPRPGAGVGVWRGPCGGLGGCPAAPAGSRKQGRAQKKRGGPLSGSSPQLRRGPRSGPGVVPAGALQRSPGPQGCGHTAQAAEARGAACDCPPGQARFPGGDSHEVLLGSGPKVGCPRPH